MRLDHLLSKERMAITVPGSPGVPGWSIKLSVAAPRVGRPQYAWWSLTCGGSRGWIGSVRCGGVGVGTLLGPEGAGESLAASTRTTGSLPLGGVGPMVGSVVGTGCWWCGWVLAVNTLLGPERTSPVLCSGWSTSPGQDTDKLLFVESCC